MGLLGGEPGGEIGQLRERGPPSACCERLCPRGQRFRITGGEHEELDVLRGERQPARGRGQPSPRGARRALDGHVHVDAAEADRADPGARGPVVRPRLDRLRGAQHGIAPDERVVRSVDPEARGDQPIAHRADGLEEPGDPGRGLGVPDERLDRADRRGSRRRPPHPRRTHRAGDRGQLGGVADLGARAMALEQRDGLDSEAGARIAAIDRDLVTGRVRSRDAALAIGRHAPPADHRMDAQAPLFGIAAPHQHDRARAFPGEKPGRLPVVDPHDALRERPQAGEPDQLEGIEADVDPAGDRGVEIARDERAARLRDRQERRAARAVDGEPAAPQIEGVADPAGDRVAEPPGQRVLVGRGQRLLELGRGRLEDGRAPGLVHALALEHGREHALDVGPPQAQRLCARHLAREAVADQDAGGRARQPLTASKPGVREGVIGDLEREPVHEVGRPRHRPRDLEPLAIDLEALDQGGAADVGRVGIAGEPCGVIGQPHAALGDRAEGAPSRERVAPQLVGRSRVGITTADPDDRDIRAHVLRSKTPGAGSGAPEGSSCERRATATASRAHSRAPRRTQTEASAKNKPYTTWSTCSAP